MLLDIKDDATVGLVTEFTQKRGVSSQDAVRLAVEAELERIAKTSSSARTDR